MAGQENLNESGKGFGGWINARFPLKKLWNASAGEYPAPKNLNFWYFFGSLALLVLVIQLISGIWLTMSYNPSSEGAFASVEYIMRDVNYGWLIRYMHSTGASAFFVVVYLHMFRSLLYGSHKKPRELIWLLGMCIYLVLMAEAFMGYLLPWGQMSYWGAQVITSLFGALPVIGEELALWIRGDYVVSGATLNRFFALHVIALPLILIILVVLHLVALHEVGSNNPEGKKVATIPFHPYYTVKDMVGVVIFLMVFSAILFFVPEMGGFFLEPPNFQPANPLVTPLHIAPVWYMTPYYAMLRAVPDQFFGVVIMGLAVAILFVLPWLDRGPVRSIRYRSTTYKVALTLFVIAFIVLGYLGTQAPSTLGTAMAQLFTAVYFLFFITLPFYSRREKVTWDTESN